MNRVIVVLGYSIVLELLGVPLGAAVGAAPQAVDSVDEAVAKFSDTHSPENIRGEIKQVFEPAVKKNQALTPEDLPLLVGLNQYASSVIAKFTHDLVPRPDPKITAADQLGAQGMVKIFLEYLSANTEVKAALTRLSKVGKGTKANSDKKMLRELFSMANNPLASICNLYARSPHRTEEWFLDNVNGLAILWAVAASKVPARAAVKKAEALLEKWASEGLKTAAKAPTKKSKSNTAKKKVEELTAEQKQFYQQCLKRMLDSSKTVSPYCSALGIQP